MLTLFDSRVVQRLALFAPRRSRKTLFLLRDLAPAALRASQVPVYASLWEDVDRPQRPILSALEFAARALSESRGLARYLEHIGRVAVSAGPLKAAVDTRPVSAARSTPDELERLDAGLRSLIDASAGQPVLLMIDEAQHLAVSDEFRPLMAALRSALDRQQSMAPGSLNVIFTGSSRTGLRAVLEDPAAPFYASAQQIEMEPLGRAYADHVVRQLARLGGPSVDSERLSKAFESFARPDRHRAAERSQCTPVWQQARSAPANCPCGRFSWFACGGRADCCASESMASTLRMTKCWRASARSPLRQRHAPECGSRSALS